MNSKKAKPAAGARTARVRVAVPKKGSAKKQAAGRTRSVGKLKTRRGVQSYKSQVSSLKKPKRKAGVKNPPDGLKPEQRTEKLKPGDMLPDGQQEYFCLKMAEGPYSQKSAYMQAYPDSAPDSARANASRLMTNDSIRGRIEFLKLELVKDVKITVEQQLLWYLKVKDTPTGFIDAESPLAQEINYDGETGVVTKIKIPSKMDAAKQIDKLMGFEKPQEINLNLPYEPPSKAMERLVGKGVNLPEILKKAGLMR